jgi:hypothetical protein
VKTPGNSQSKYPRTANIYERRGEKREKGCARVEKKGKKTEEMKPACRMLRQPKQEAVDMTNSLTFVEPVVEPISGEER